CACSFEYHNRCRFGSMTQALSFGAGTIGHVAHGKSTVVKAISGVQTVRFKNELERNITIKLGYANAKVYRCKNPRCPRCGYPPAAIGISNWQLYSQLAGGSAVLVVRACECPTQAVSD